MSDAIRQQDYCHSCGKLAPGAERWMFHAGEPPAKEFHCDRCRRRMQFYAAIGLSLLGLLVTALVTAVVLLGGFQ